jgi:tRNA dimethylallyltransferase
VVCARSGPLPSVVVLVGTTASGKSDLGLRLAPRLDAEIVSADSRQVYRGLDIGTGKVTPAERALVPHHLLDVADVRERFTVAQYQQLALRAIEEIWARGRVPLLVGGTGLYVRAVVDNPAYPAVPPDPRLRADLEARPLADLVVQLEQLDPDGARQLDLRNPRRVVRALEVTLATGIPFSQKRTRGRPREIGRASWRERV